MCSRAPYEGTIGSGRACFEVCVVYASLPKEHVKQHRPPIVPGSDSPGPTRRGRCGVPKYSACIFESVNPKIATCVGFRCGLSLPSAFHHARPAHADAL